MLEFLVEITYPFSPEIGTTVCWVGGQLLGAVFILVQDALKAGREAEPPSNMRDALIFSAAVSGGAVPLALALGLFGRDVSRRRLGADQGPRAPVGDGADLEGAESRAREGSVVRLDIHDAK